MVRPVYNGKAKDNGKGFDYKTFESYFIEGMVQKILADLAIKKRVNEYVINDYIIIAQIQCAFCNLTWFLTGHGYNNEENIDECKKILEFMSLIFSMNLSNWNLNQVGFVRANLNDSKLTNVNFKKVYMSDANLYGADLKYANLSGADMSGANLSKADLKEANLSGADLGGAYLSGADLRGADLSEAKLRGAYLTGADLGGAYLSGADLSRADLRGADLIRADLSGADLSRADLRGADLIRADLSRADLNGAKYCLDKEYKTIFPAGFNPKEHGMIEVDIDGNPVKNQKQKIMWRNKNDRN